MKRKIIQIDHDKCNGCGQCIPNCPEGAMQLIDGKARLISDLFCDGLGACIGSCPVGAITVIEREAQDYDEKKVMANIIAQGPNVILAHLKHLYEHRQCEYMKQALECLQEKNIAIPSGPWNEAKSQENEPCHCHEHAHEHAAEHHEHAHHGHTHEHHGMKGSCPSAKPIDLAQKVAEATPADETIPSQLSQWPVQLHLISPNATYFQNCDLLVVADCVAYALGDFHRQYLAGKRLIIACPKLDEGMDVYLEKIKVLLGKVKSVTVMIMEVPCCRGLFNLVMAAYEESSRFPPLRCITVGLQGNIISDSPIEIKK